MIRALLAHQQRAFIFFSMCVGFLISAEYAITRPASSSLFLSLFSSAAIPWVWLISVPINLLVVYLYSRYLPRLGPLTMLGGVGLLTVAINTAVPFLSPTPSWLIFVQFIWKDTYILLMFKQLWSMIHATIAPHQSRYLYGAIFSMGTLGSIIGSTIPGFLAVSVGSSHLFLATLPIYLFLYLSYAAAFRRSSLNLHSFSTDLTLDPSGKEGFSLVYRSPLLMGILFLVIFMQVSVGLMDYQFNIYLETNILETDLRTAYCGKIVGLTNSLSAAFQLFGSLLMVRYLGLRGSHFFIPLILLSNATLCWLFPSFMMISFSYVFLKSIDFSLLGVIREMLYVPLKLDEKFRAKAIIDVFAYRSAKAIVSLGTLILQLVAGIYLLKITALISICVFVGWLVMLTVFLRKQIPTSVQ